MAKQVTKGQFYDFNKANAGYEIGGPISVRDAQLRIRSGKNVYTPAAADAKTLSKDVDPTHPGWHPAHQKGYFPHYHPDDHENDAYGHIFYGQRGEEAAAWPGKKQVAKVGQAVIWQIEGDRPKRPFSFEAGMQIDADGAPNAYHPGRTRGLDNLDNAGRAGKWWALVTDGKGEPIVQGARDPAPGFYVSKTALENKNWPETDPRRYVDSTTIPYFVLPKVTLDTLGPRLGDLGLVMNRKNSQTAYAIYADKGPAHEIGEGSIALAKTLGINSNPRGGGTSGGVIYVVSPGSGNGFPRSLAEINSVAESYFLEWGGMDWLHASFPEFFA